MFTTVSHTQITKIIEQYSTSKFISTKKSHMKNRRITHLGHQPCKAGITRNQHCLCKLIRPISCFSFSASTSQKVPYLVCKTHRYDAPLQCLQGRILKILILLEEMLKYYIILLNMFFLL